MMRVRTIETAPTAPARFMEPFSDVDECDQFCMFLDRSDTSP